MKSILSDFLDLSFINYVRFFKKTELYQPSYNPSERFLYNAKLDKRSSDDRLEQINKHLPTPPGSYLDIGSQLGYFVMHLSKKGYFSTGIEINSVSCEYASCLLRLSRQKNACFLNMPLDKDSVLALPEYDIVSILSVYHHMVYFMGEKDANFVIGELIKRCRKTFFFETGEFAEKGFYWTEGLSFMGSNSSLGVQKFLEKFEFSKIEKIGENSTHLTDHKRSLFMCHK